MVMVRRSLGISRDGTRAAVASGDRLFLVDAHGASAAVTFDLGPVADIASVGNELWVAAGQPLALHRFTAAGNRIGEPSPLWGDGHRGALRAVAVGAIGALWSAPAQAMLPADRGAIAIPGEPDCVVPVSLHRWVVSHRDRISLRDLGTRRWDVEGAIARGQVVDGAALLEGRTAALVVAQRDDIASELVVVGLHNGAIHHRISLTGIDVVRFAPARGLAIMRQRPRTLILIDLRFGRVLKEHTEERDVVDVSIDDVGLTFVLRHGDSPTDVVVGSVRALLGQSSTAARSIASPGASPGAGPGAAPAAVLVSIPAGAPCGAPARDRAATVVEPAPSPPRMFHRGHAALGSVAALSPRTEITALAPAQAVALLERYRALVAAMISRAIAQAWDDGRIAFSDEGSLPFHGEVAGILGSASGRARDELAAAEQRIEQAVADLHAAEVDSGPGFSPLAMLAGELELSPLARLLLLLVAGPSLWGELARLYCILGNDPDRPPIDELLLVEIVAGQASRHDVARELDRDAPLIRHGLIRCGEAGTRPFVALACEPIALHLLRATDAVSDLDDIAIVHASHDLADLLIPAATKDAIAGAVAIAPSGPGRVVVRGRSGSGRHALLATLARAANRSLGVIDAAAVLRDPRRGLDQLRIALRRAHLLGLLPCINGLEALPSDDPSARDMLAQILDRHPGPLAIRSAWDAHPPLAPGYLQIDLPSLSMAERTACWEILLTEHALAVSEPEQLGARYSVGPGVIARACAAVASARAGEPRGASGDVAAPDASIELEQAVRQHLETRLCATATRVYPLASWSRVVLPPDIQDSVLELIARIRHRRTVYDTWGYDRIAATSRGVTAVFQGAHGTGKTLVASAIANELGMDLYRVELARVISTWAGETELAGLFDAAEDGHTIILFDDADSLFAKRTEVLASADRRATLVVDYLLHRLDSFTGVAILTTSFGKSIDHAFARRLSLRLTLPFPDEASREAIWKSHIAPGIPCAGNFDFAALARRHRLSGGCIRNAAVRAAFLAAEEHAPLTQDHLERAVRAELREIAKLSEGGSLE